MRICSLPEAREKRFAELKALLLTRGYRPGCVDAAISKARDITRAEALQKVVRNKAAQRSVFAITYDPRLPSITKVVTKHWRSMTQDPYLKDVFPLPPLVAYKRQPNLRDKLIRAKVPDQVTRRPKRNVPGMKKCLNCPICPFVQPGRSVTSTANTCTVDINTAVTCKTRNIIYCITCKRCSEQYIGESERSLQERFSEHRGYVTNRNLTKATGLHFNQRGHSVSDMSVSIVEKVYSKNENFRKEREKMFINKMQTKYRGMNRKI